MRIGFFTETYHPQSNGVVTSIDSFGKELTKDGYQIHLFCPKSNKKTVNGMTVHSFPALKFRPYPEYKIGVPTLRKIPQLDIVHTHGPFTMGSMGLTIAKKRKIPAISTFHTLLPEYLDYVTRKEAIKKHLGNASWKYLKMHYRWYERLIAPSQAIKELMIEKMNLHDIEVIPTGINIQDLTPTPQKKAREELGIKQEDKILLFLGRISHEKSIGDAIDSMRYLYDHKLYIAGKGPSLPKLKSQVEKHGLKDRVRFLGFVPEQKKKLYYSAADAFIMPSKTDTQGMVVLEAMACGCPVVAADALALPEYVDYGKNGYLYHAGVPEDLALVISNNFDKLKSMRKHARRTAEEYSEDKMTEKIKQVYEELSPTI